MTVSTTNNSTTGLGNGATTVFSYNFLMPAASDAVIIYTDSTGVPVTIGPSLYLITGIGNPIGGTVIYPLSGSPIATGTTLTIERILPLVQDTSISNQGAFYPEVTESAFDYEMMCIQQLQDEINSLQAQITAIISSLPIPPSIPPTGALNVKQLKLQLISINQMVNVSNAILADVTQVENVQWFTGGFTSVGDALSDRIQTVLGYTNAQMVSLYAVAASQPA